MTDEESNIAKVLTEVASSLEAPLDLETTVLQITEAVVDTVPEVDAASVSLTRKDGNIETIGATAGWITETDELQHQLREGPCFTAATDDAPTVVAEAMGEDPRWPEYGPRAAELGVGSQVAFRLETDQGGDGALNLYSKAPFALSDDCRQLGELFAAQLAVALGWSRYEETLQEALATRKVIGQAIGIVMERFTVDQETAFRYLVRLSRDTNVKVRLIAEELVGTANTAGRASA